MHLDILAKRESRENKCSVSTKTRQNETKWMNGSGFRMTGIAPISISSNEVHLWIAHDEECTDPDLLAQYSQLLNDAESAQQQRFHFESHRHQYLVTRALVRSVLSLYNTDITAENWQFGKNRYGKPHIDNPFQAKPLQFNISHTEKMVVLAVAHSHDVGVDVEYLSRRGDTLEIAENYFSTAETAELFDLPADRRKSRFFDLWTLKEAYIKACGKGLAIPLNQFSYHFPREDSIDITLNPELQDDESNWSFWQFSHRQAHRVAIALKHYSPGTPHTLKVREITPLKEMNDVEPLTSLCTSDQLAEPPW